MIIGSSSAHTLSVRSRALSHPTAFVLIAAAQACLPPERPASASGLVRRQAVRVTERTGDAIQSGTLVRLTSDSVVWHPDTAALRVRALPLDAVTRVEVAEPLSQRAAARRGLIRGRWSVRCSAPGSSPHAPRPPAAPWD